MFWFLEEDQIRDNSAVLRCPKKSYKNYHHFAPIAPKLRLSIDRRFSFYESVNSVSFKNRAMVSRVRD